jgi:predicted NUDIX family NTP pyrophosphohydrolase
MSGTASPSSATSSSRASPVPDKSAGVLLFRRRDAGVEIFLVHPGGPFWAKKEDGAWSIPKGLYEDDEDPFVAAQREFAEEVGTRIEGEFIGLGEFRLPSGKRLSVWAVEGDIDATKVTSNSFEMEWPPHSGKRAQFPEVDRADWFGLVVARRKLTKGQVQILDAFGSEIGAR